MLVKAVSDETYCLKTHRHALIFNGRHSICYRCGMLFGSRRAPKLGSLLDY